MSKDSSKSVQGIAYTTATDYGCSVSYWRITKFEIDIIAQSAKISLWGYISEETFTKSNKPLINGEFTIALNGGNIDLQNPIKMLNIALEDILRDNIAQLMSGANKRV